MRHVIFMDRTLWASRTRRSPVTFDQSAGRLVVLVREPTQKVFFSSWKLFPTKFLAEWNVCYWTTTPTPNTHGNIALLSNPIVDLLQPVMLRTSNQVLTDLQDI
jgi:hypothetical protein